MSQTDPERQSITYSCPHCDGPIKELAEKCPHCNQPIEDLPAFTYRPARGPAVKIIAILIVAMILLASLAMLASLLKTATQTNP